MAQETRNQEKAAVRERGALIAVDVEQYEKELVQRKEQQREINKNHQKEVTRQIDERKKMLKYVGSQVMGTTEGAAGAGSG